MPNWVYNYMTINKKYKNLIINKEGDVDFGIIKPMPEELNLPEDSDKNICIY